MLVVLIDVLLLVLRSFIAVSLNRLKIKRITLIRFNRTQATTEELELAKEINKSVSGKRGAPSSDSVMKASDQIQFGDRSKVTSRANEIEQELLDMHEENLKSIASARGIGFISNKTPYTEAGDSKSFLISVAKEEGENFVIGTAANAALVGSVAATGGAAAVIGVTVDIGITTVRGELDKLSEEEEERKEKYVQENAGDVLMLSRNAKKRIREEALARASAEDQDERARVEQPGLVPGGPEWEAKKRRLDQSISGLKWMLKAIDFVFAILTVIIIMMVIVIALVSLVMLAIVSFAASGVSDPPKKADTTAGTGTVKTEPKAGANTGGSTAVPAGIDPASWNSADEWGKKIASRAIESSIMTIDTPGTASNGGHLVYQQGDTPIGVYDCTVFVGAVYETFGKTFTGGTRPGTYDFKTNKKSDLNTYMNTTGMNAYFAGKPEMNIGQAFVGDWESKIHVGDMLLLGGHVAFYVGKNLAGTHMMAHAGSPNAETYYDPAFTKRGTQVGLGYLGDASQWPGQMLIIRPQVAFK